MLALAVTVPIATFFGITDDEGVFHPNIPAPLLLCLTMLCIGTVAFLFILSMIRNWMLLRRRRGGT